MWGYPHRPRLERVPERLRVVMAGATVADTTSGWRVLETGHPPSYHFPPGDILAGRPMTVAGQSWCEWKVRASYLDVVAGSRRASRAAWCNREPTPPFAAIRDHVALQPALVLQPGFMC